MNNISIVRNIESGYYNLTKICNDHNIDFNVILSSKWFNELIIQIIDQLNDCHFKSFEDISFKLENGTHDESNYRGIYGHKLFVITLCSYCSMKNKLNYNYNYVLSVMNILNEIDTSINNKYQEYQNTVKDLTLPINRIEKTSIIVQRIDETNIYKITKSKDKKFLTNDDKYLTLSYVNGDDVYEIFISVMKKYNKLGPIKRIKSQHYEILDIDQFKQIIDEIKLNMFNVNDYIEYSLSNIDNRTLLIDKLKQDDSKKTCLLGLLYETFVLEYLQQKYETKEIYLWRNLPQKICNTLNVNRRDYGKDIIDFKNKIIYQCKYYTGAKLVYKNVDSFIKESLCYADIGFKSVLVCPSITTIANSVVTTLRYYNIEIIRYEATDMLKLLENNDISIETRRFNLNKYIIEHLEDKDDDIMTAIHNNYKTNFNIDDLNEIKLKLNLNKHIHEIYRKTPAQIKSEYVLENWDKTDLELVEYLNKTPELSITMKGLEQIRRRLATTHKNLVLPYRSKLLSSEINDYIRENHNTKTNLQLSKEIKEKFNYDISEDGVNSRKCNIGLTVKKEVDEWSKNKQDIDEYVGRYYKTKTIKELQKSISEYFKIPLKQCTYDRVRACIRKIPLDSRKEIMLINKREDVKQYILEHPGLTTDEYMDILKCSKTCILNYAKEIELEQKEPIITRQTIPSNKRTDIDDYIIKNPGLSNCEYARRLKCSKQTIANHLKTIKQPPRSEN